MPRLHSFLFTFSFVGELSFENTFNSRFRLLQTIWHIKFLWKRGQTNFWFSFFYEMHAFRNVPFLVALIWMDLSSSSKLRDTSFYLWMRWKGLFLVITFAVIVSHIFLLNSKIHYSSFHLRAAPIDRCGPRGPRGHTQQRPRGSQRCCDMNADHL